MALLTDDIQDKLIKLLVDEGLIEKPVIDAAVKRAVDVNKPLFSLLADEGILDNELLVHAVAQVSGVPYVNLENSMISQDILSLLPSDIAERFMAVPLAEVQNRLAASAAGAVSQEAVSAAVDSLGTTISTSYLNGSLSSLTTLSDRLGQALPKIGRASCRERV